MRSVADRLQDIADAAQAILRRLPASAAVLEKEELLYVWMLHHLMLIGEASAALPADFRQEHSEVPWSKVIGMRNVLIHAYFGTDANLVWEAVSRDVPVLAEQVARWLSARQN